ncbi:glycine--tRNA ligase [Candidatus Micrarchaeota archaeon]|nr:glycine--tRNA ligase [Candidatus Micrarchaeota archaeon]
MTLHEKIFDLALKRSIFYPSNEPYGAVSGFYDYGPVGSLLKQKIERLWRRIFIKENGYLEVESSIITPEPVLKASGHVDAFGDPIVECPKCGINIRADSFIADKLPNFKWDGKLESLDKTIAAEGMKCPKCDGPLSKAHMFNLMFKTGMGADRAPAYARPETAQGIFTSFPRLFKNHGTKLPLAVGQVGRSFRNEISPRKGLVRMREFTQMELEYFFSPAAPGIEDFGKVAEQKMRFQIDGKMVVKNGSEAVAGKITPNEIFAYFLVKEWEFYKQVGINETEMYFRVLGSEETPHYSKRNIDMEVQTSFGIIETIGNAYRTDFDLSQHAKTSGEDFSVFLEQEKKKIVPHVFEVSMGVDRLIFCMLEHCFRAATKEKDWEWFDFPPAVSPYELAVYPLMKKDGMDEKAQEIAAQLKKRFDVLYRDSGSIGRRYARGDEIGVLASVTIDYDTMQDGTVTLRYRNTGEQVRVTVPQVVEMVDRFLGGESWESMKGDYKAFGQQ